MPDYTLTRSLRLTLSLGGILCGLGVSVLLFADPVMASNAAVGLGEGGRNELSIPRWLYVATGGAAVGASALLAGFVTDRRLISAIHTYHQNWLFSNSHLQRIHICGAVAGGTLFIYALFRGLRGPSLPAINAAIIVVFAGFRAGITMLTYLIGNAWSILSPISFLRRHDHDGVFVYPQRLGRWPAVSGILFLIWIETVSEITTSPRTLAAGLFGYLMFTLTGGGLFGFQNWFNNVDPVTVFFHAYARFAPFTRDRTQLKLSFPGMRLVTASEPTATQTDDPLVSGYDDVALVILLVWELTFSGFVTTTVGAQMLQPLVSGSIPAPVVYGGVLLIGFSVFFLAFVFAGRVACARLRSTRDSSTLIIAFAPSLLAVAVGYHLAHYAGFLISLSPSIANVITTPLTPASNPVVLTLPRWFAGINIVCILAGHVLAIWVAHSIAYCLFSSRLQAIRSQYPFVAVMVFYTAISLWLISLPTASPPGVA